MCSSKIMLEGEKEMKEKEEKLNQAGNYRHAISQGSYTSTYNILNKARGWNAGNDYLYWEEG